MNKHIKHPQLSTSEPVIISESINLISEQSERILIILASWSQLCALTRARIAREGEGSEQSKQTSSGGNILETFALEGGINPKYKKAHDYQNDHPRKEIPS